MTINGEKVWGPVSAGVYYAVSVTQPNGNCCVHLTTDLPRKNLSGVGCVNGWLGSTDGVNRWAIGIWEIKPDSLGRMRAICKT